jgi:hypothetical protein
MAKEKIIQNCARTAGVLLLAATALHASLGTGEVEVAIKLGDVRASMADNYRLIWILSSMMLLLNAIWVFFLAGELRKMLRRAWWQGMLVGLGYAGSSILGMATVGPYALLFVFALIGLLLLVPLVVWARHFKASST